MAALTAAPATASSLGAARSSAFGNGAAIAAPKTVQLAVVRTAVVCRAEQAEEVATTTRRAALTLFAGAAALTLRSGTAEAAYGEAANVFGPSKKSTGFIPYTGNGFKLDIPSKWNPSKEIEYPGTVVRFEDNFDATNNLSVTVTPAKKSSIGDYGSPENFLDEVSFLLGRQSYNGKTQSEGGFNANQISTASVLAADKVAISGKEYYKISVLTRTADGDEGGKHQLITAAVSDGKLYVLKVQAGDKRWFKGTKKLVEGASDSFSVA